MKLQPIKPVMFGLNFQQPYLLWKDKRRKVYPATKEGLRQALDDYAHEVDVIV